MTRIADLLAKGRTYSFEFFPPKTDAEQALLVKTLRALEPLEPSFVSVTYRGGAESRKRTFDLVTGMLRTTTLVPMAHLICAAHTRLELADILVAYRTAGVENLMALGGDPPEDPEAGVGELRYASELVELATAIGGFSIGVAAQPAGHPQSVDRKTDRDNLAAKLRLADFGVTQFFFEASEYTNLVGELAERGGGQARPPRHHAGRPPVVDSADGHDGCGRAAVDGRPAGGSRLEWWQGGRASRGRGHRHRALPGAARRQRARVALLHAQPVDGDPRDLRRPRPGRGPDRHLIAVSPGCACCGSAVEDRDAVTLFSHPEVALCFRCLDWLNLQREHRIKARGGGWQAIGVEPTFFVRDVTRSAEHYECLGFEVSYYDTTHAVAKHVRGVTIHLVLADWHGAAGHGSVCLLVPDVDEASAAWRSAGVEVIGPEAVDGHPEGMHTDPDGNLIRIRSPVTTAPAPS